MTERKPRHIALHYVLPSEERDTWSAQDEETKASWRNALLGGEQLDAPGEAGNYTVSLTEEQAEAFRAAKNCRYVVEEEIAAAHGDPDDVEIVAEAKTFQLNEEHVEDLDAAIQDFAFPEALAMRYHNATGTEKNEDAGRGFLVWHLDTGVSGVIERMTPGGVVFRKNYVGGSSTADDNGHGSMTCSLAVPNGAALAVCKVLSANGSGSSVGITAAIRQAAAFVKANPQYHNKTVLSGSLGGSPGQRFQPYVDACREAEEAGVLCDWSAGNDGVHGISAPANWKDSRASIAFVRETDRRASFSNYDDSAALATQGQNVLMIDRYGNLVRGNGTSFSLPFYTRHVIVGAWIRSASVFRMAKTMMATARNSPEPTVEEASGVANVWEAINKLTKGKAK